MRRVLIIFGLVLVVAAFAAHVANGRAPRASLTAVKICSGADQDRFGACRYSNISNYPEVRCSVRVHAPTRTRFTAKLFYEGQLERSYSEMVRGDHGRAMAVAFATLGVFNRDDYGTPGGRYRCEFTLGSAHATVSAVSGGPTGRVRGAVACRAYGTASRICMNGGDPPVAEPRALACNVVLVRMVGATAETQLQRHDGDTWTTLYDAQDRITVPIAEVWAYTTVRDAQFFPAGDYRCRFLAGGTEVARVPFTVTP